MELQSPEKAFIPHPFFRIIDVVRLWCKIEDEIQLNEQGFPDDPKYPEAEVRAMYLKDAINYKELKFGFYGVPHERYKPNRIPFNPLFSEITIRRKDLKEWLANCRPFGWQEFHSRFLEAEDEGLNEDLDGGGKRLLNNRRGGTKNGAQDKIVDSTRSLNTFYSAIGGLMELYRDDVAADMNEANKKLPATEISKRLVEKYPNHPKIKQSTLNELFLKAERFFLGESEEENIPLGKKRGGKKSSK